MAEKYTEAQKRATTAYLKTLTSISIRVKPEAAERYRRAAKKCGMSLREFILTCLDEKIKSMEE